MTKSKSWNTYEEDNKAWDTLFPHQTDDIGDYLNLEGPREEMQDIRPSTQVMVTT